MSSNSAPSEVEQPVLFGSLHVNPEAPLVFDAAQAVADFIADVGQHSLELPGVLSPEQRKHARQIAEQCPDIRCESYGFGAERRLHLFRQDRSKAELKVEESGTVDGGADVASERTSASGYASHTPSTGSPESSSRVLPGSPVFFSHDSPTVNAGIPVRNTFVHFEAASVSERIVQSMPDDFFRQCLSEEADAHEQTPVSDPVSAAPTLASLPAAVMPPTVAHLTPGTEVVIEGLVKAPAFNGRTGVVQYLDAESGRYTIQLLSASGGMQVAKVRGENLRLVASSASPVRFTPMVVAVEEQISLGGGLLSVPSTPLWEEHTRSLLPR
jgi:hypothetical protein